MRPAGATLLILAAVACGYSVVQSGTPFGAHRVAVLPFQENVPLGLSPELTAALSSRLADGGVRLTNDAATAEAVLSGTILAETAYKSPVAAVDATIPAYQIQVAVRAELRRGAAVVWSTETAAKEAFLSAVEGPSATQTLATEANRTLALHRLAQTLAQRLHDRLLIDAATTPGG